MSRSREVDLSRLREAKALLVLWFFGMLAPGEWVELSRGSIAARTALAVRAAGVEPGPKPEPTEEGAAHAGASAAALVVRANGADVVVPEGVTEAHLAMVLRAVASL